MSFKKITLTTGIFPPDIGGPASFIPMFAQFLVEQNIEVEVVTLSDKKEDYSYLPYKVKAISRKIKKPLRDFFVIGAIIQSAKKSDLIFCNTLAFESAIAAKIIQKPLIQKVVGDIAWERANASGRFSGTLDQYQIAQLDLKSKFTNYYRNFAIFQSDYIITPSYYLKKVVQGWGYNQEKIGVIYNNVELKQQQKEIPRKKFRIISVARLVPHKGIGSILKTLETLKFNFEYIVIGDGPLKKDLQSLVQELKLDVNFLGNVSKQEVANYLGSSDLFILNSSYEGLPHVVLEAMANRCSVIASAVGGTPEVVKNMQNGLLFEFNNKEELKQKIELLQQDKELKQKLLVNAQEFVKSFTDVKQMSQQYLEVFKESTIKKPN